MHNDAELKRDDLREKQKRTYEKPQLRVIELAAEEVLGFGCKLSSGGRAVGSPANCVSNGCHVAAS